VLTRRAFFRRLLADPKARELLMNTLAVGEADSAVDLDRVASHVADDAIARRIYRHYAEEQRHARLLGRRLEELGFEIAPLPPELDYERYLQRFHLGTPRSRLDDPAPFSPADLVLFFCGSIAAEERACEEMTGLVEALGEDPGTARVLRAICADELRHVSYATEELQRLAAAGRREEVSRALRRARRAEARAHRLVSRAFMRRLMTMLGYPRAIQILAGLRIDLAFAARWLFPGGLDEPRIADAMGIPDRSTPQPRESGVVLSAEEPR
jgi:hypothetical protein